MRIFRRGDALVVQAPAKVNLHLEVLARRGDGYHDLETVMAAVNLFDTLTLTPAPRGELRLTQRLALDATSLGDAPPVGDSNLVLRAARALVAATGTRAGVSIELTKRIPWQAGLGGGSSDAAATLLGLVQFWGLELPAGELDRLAAQLGSDLNFFIARTPLALCTGRGELVAPRSLRRRLDLVIAQPRGGLSTAAVFREWHSRSQPQSAAPLLEWLSGSPGRTPAPSAYNALEAAAWRLHAGIAETCTRLSRAGAVCVAMTGSGSACFGLCRSRRHATTIARRLRQSGDCRTWVVCTL